MIIVLKNADFSKSNIGTLSSWRISRSLGAGATYVGPTSVDKGAAFTATVTLAEGYEIGTVGVTVTMGGAVLEGAHSISGNVITITITSVTGNVLIKVPTVNTATGEEEEPEEPDIPVVPDEPGTGGDDNAYTLTAADIRTGGWGLYDQMENDTRISVKELINLTAGTTITWEIPSSLKMTITVLKADGTTTDLTNAIYRQLWATGSGEYTVQEDAKMHLIWAKTTDTQTISVSDWGGIYTIDSTPKESTPEEGTPEEGTFTTYTLTANDIESGGWGWYDKMDNDKRLRTKELIPVPAGSVITVDIPSTLKLCITVVKKDNSSTSINTCIIRDLWTTQKTFNVTEDGYLHFVWAKTNDSQPISVSDWGGTYSYQISKEA